jgi:cellulose synthase/poly-beta-1,6-N-acetylglucosamine synthase-like glycosyltransferase
MDTNGPDDFAKTVSADVLHKTWGLLEAEKPHHRVSVIIPIYNEVDSIDILMDRLFGTLDRHFSDDPSAFEIIAVNDGSTDGSLRKLTQRSLI